MSTIAVAVSGGVDSLYALWHLRQQGHSVCALHGLFLPNQPKPDCDPVPQLRLNCQKLGIALHVLDLRHEFERLVISPFIAAYAAGHTPNPCALCNARIKFGLLLDAALALGAEQLATGHYARLEQEAGRTRLAAAADNHKDQSYFLSLVPQERLAHALFPLARVHKDDARLAIAQAGLTVPLPKESQDVCFVPQEYRPFVEAGATARGISLGGAGAALLPDGTYIGEHKGLWRYTEGQRKGMGFAWKEPLFVQQKEREGNVLRLVPRAALGMLGCRTQKANYFVPPALLPHKVLARLRYRQALMPATLSLLPQGGFALSFEQPQFPSAVGQIAALYDEQGRLLAGGIIEEITMCS